MPTALIVEDEPQANELLAMLVQLRGYRTESAFTGSDALELVGRARPDLVFLDLMLPDRSGYDVCRSLRSARGTATVPIVMVTARLEAENRIEGFRSGANDYIPKPYTPDQIFATIDRSDAWSRRLGSGDLLGFIPLDARPGASALPEVSRLAGLIVGRSEIPDGQARRAGRALVEFAIRAEAWGVRNGKGLVANLSYRSEADELGLAIRDESGWFRDESPLDPQGPLARVPFPEVDYLAASGVLVLGAGPSGLRD